MPLESVLNVLKLKAGTFSGDANNQCEAKSFVLRGTISQIFPWELASK